MTGIFISYRRKENKAHARLVFQDLRRRYRRRVFMDVDGLQAGERFRHRISRQLDGCTVLLALMGPQWAQVRDDKSGVVRLFDARDYVRMEIARALHRGITVIPVLIDGAVMPQESELPPDLHPLLERHAFALDLDQDFDAGMEKLADAVQASMPADLRVPGWVKYAVSVTLIGAGLGYAHFNGQEMFSAKTPSAVTATSAITATPATPVASSDPYPSGTRFRDCEEDACPWMVVIPAGVFLMGSPDRESDREKDESPQHRVSVAKVAMGQHEVTQGQWTALMGSNPSGFKDCGDACPVDGVSWDDAQSYVRALSEKTGKTYRLPSEAEWEYAARAGMTMPFHTGRTITSAQANFDGNYTYNGSAKGQYREKTTPVGTFHVNGFGLSDMHGNVWEWVEDCWHQTYEKSPDHGESWVVDCMDSRRVMRGGSWANKPWSLRLSYRGRSFPATRDNDTGLRVVRTL